MISKFNDVYNWIEENVSNYDDYAGFQKYNFLKDLKSYLESIL